MEENEETEFKETLDEKKIPQTMAAFSNHKGGKIYVGIKDNGKVIGVKIGKNKIEQFTRKIHDEAQPTILFDTDFEKIDDKTIRMLGKHHAHEIASNKTSTARNKNSLHNCFKKRSKAPCQTSIGSSNNPVILLQSKRLFNGLAAGLI